MAELKSDQGSPNPPCVALLQKDEQKPGQPSTETRAHTTGEVEPLEVADDPEASPTVRSKLQTASILLMLSVRPIIVRHAASAGFLVCD